MPKRPMATEFSSLPLVAERKSFVTSYWFNIENIYIHRYAAIVIMSNFVMLLDREEICIEH